MNTKELSIDEGRRRGGEGGYINGGEDYIEGHTP